MPKQIKRCPKCGRTHPMRVLTCDCGAKLPDATDSAPRGNSIDQSVREVLTPWYLLNYVGFLVGQVIAAGGVVMLGRRYLDVMELAPSADEGPLTGVAPGALVVLILLIIGTGMVTAVGLYALRQMLFKRKITWQRVLWFAAFGAMWWLAIIAMLSGLFPAMEFLTFNESNGGNLWPWLPLGLSLLIAAIPAALLVGREGD